MRVQQVVESDGNWDWSWLERKVPGNVMQLIKAIPPPCSEDGDDRVVWRGGNGGDFSVAQLYNRRRGDVNAASEVIWKYVWQVKTTKRIQVFLWLAVQDRLLIGTRRSRLLGGTSPCGRCRAEVEDREHALRSCTGARKIWEAIGATKMIWNWRNRFLFENDFSMPNRPALVIRKYVEECISANRKYDDVGLRKYPQEVKWCFPSEGWVKLNFDGSAKGCLGDAGCGGVLRKADGSWVGGFSMKLGCCNALIVELWGAVHGMKLAQDMGIPKIMVEGDSISVILLLQEAWIHGKSDNRILNTWIRQCNRNIQVCFCHTLREGNSAADWMANNSFSCNNDVIYIGYPPVGVLPFLFSDQVGTVYPRDSFG